MGTENGVCRLNPLTNELVAFPVEAGSRDNIANFAIHAVVGEELSGNNWAGGFGLFIINKEDKTLKPAPGNLNQTVFFGKDILINKLIADRSRFWLATSKGIFLYNLQDYSWQKVDWQEDVKEKPGFEYITNLYLDPEGTLWATSWGSGLLEIDTSLRQITGFHLLDPGKIDGAHNIFNGITQTNYPGEEDIIWLSGISGGLHAFSKSTGTFTSYGSRDADDINRVYTECYSLYFHPRTGLWIGSKLGIYQYDGFQQLFREYNPVSQDNRGEDIYYYFNLIYADPSDSSGNTVWLGTNNNGLFRYNLKSGLIEMMNYHFGDYLKPEIYVSGIFRDDRQVLWIATLLNGLLRYDPVSNSTMRFTFENQANPEIKWINAFKEDVNDHNKILVATNHGLFSFDKQALLAVSVEIKQDGATLPGPMINGLFQQADGTVWIFGSSGNTGWEFLAKQLAGSASADIMFSNKGDENDPRLYINDLVCTPDGEVFLATYEGLFHFNGKEENPQITKFVHENHNVRSRVEQLLLDKRGNIWALITDDVYLLDMASRKIHELTFEDLRKNAKLNLNENEITGEMMLGSWFRFYSIRADSTLLASEPPSKYITGLRIGTGYHNGRPADLTNQRITLPYDKNNITVEFTAINFRVGSFNKFACKMEGFDDGWTFTDNQSVSYKLPPGKYSFQLKAANASGLWDEDYVYAGIVIRPPFYRTWWFALIILILVAAFIYSIYKYRINQLLKLQKMRDNISRDLHDDIGSSLTNIAIMNELAVQEKRRGGDPEKILSKSAEDIHEVISSLSDIVWNVNPVYDDLKYLMARMRWYASEVLDNTDILYSLDILEPDAKITMNMEQRRDFYLVFKEGLNNLVKYSGASKAEVMIKVEDDSVLMIIKDDGKGFEPENIEFGNGLKNMRQRTETWKGNFTIISKKGQGTELRFIIPVEN